MIDYMIIDLQWGSTGKGLIAGYLAETERPSVAISQFGPNAGHTYIDFMKRKHIFKMLPMGCLSPEIEYVLLGPGSVIAMDRLDYEVAQLESKSIYIKHKIIIHPNAAILQPIDSEREKELNRIGSTQQGTMEAAIRKLRRDTIGVAKDYPYLVENYIVSRTRYEEVIEHSGHRMQIEASQGYDLSVDSRWYPYCTSRNITPAAVFDQIAMPWRQTQDIEIIGSMRTLPIRVANRYDDAGTMVGYSGGCWEDQEEITWERVGVEPELTTVTKLQRRIFSFSVGQYLNAIRMCAPDKIFLNFCNYLDEDDLALHIPRIIINEQCRIQWEGYGPTYEDVRNVDN